MDKFHVCIIAIILITIIVTIIIINITIDHLEYNASSANKDGDGEDPQKEAIHHHGNVFPVLDYLKLSKIWQRINSPQLSEDDDNDSGNVFQVFDYLNIEITELRFVETIKTGGHVKFLPTVYFFPENNVISCIICVEVQDLHTPSVILH